MATLTRKRPLRASLPTPKPQDSMQEDQWQEGGAGWVREMLSEHAEEQAEEHAVQHAVQPAENLPVDWRRVKPQAWDARGELAVGRAERGEQPIRQRSPAAWLRLFAEVQDSLGAVASPSDGDRFSRPPAAKARPRTDTRDTRALDLAHPAAQALAQAYPGSVQFGEEVELSPRVQRVILELAICGKPTQLQGCVKRVTMVPAQIAAEVGEILEQPVTERHIKLVRRAGLRAVGAYLRKKGLAPPPRKREREGEETMSNALRAQGYDLFGWDEISEYMERDPSGLLRLMKRDSNPLPVKKFGERGRVVAKRMDLNAWAEREVGSAQRAS